MVLHKLAPVGPRVFLCHPPAHVNLNHVDKLFPAASSQLWEYKPREQVSLPVHVSECWRDEHTYSAPPSNKWKVQKPKSIIVFGLWVYC